MWELLQTKVLQSNFQNVGTITNQSFTVKLSNCGNYYKSKFYSQIFKLWELLQIEVLQSNFQNVGTITNRSFTVKLSKCGNYYKSWILRNES